MATIASRPAIPTPTPMPACWPVVRPEEVFVIGAGVGDGDGVEVVVAADFKELVELVELVAVDAEVCEDVTLVVVVVEELPVILNE